MDSTITPIETVYKGYRFRSRLEARWAVFFDVMGIKWEYEPEGFELSDGSLYLPDFYLTESKAFFEAKGIMSETDKQKINTFIRGAKRPVTIGYSGMEFEACDNWKCEDEPKYELVTKGESLLWRCRECGGISFMGTNGLYTCPCCGYWDGDHQVELLAYGDHADDKPFKIFDEETMRAILKAKQARFEHGETPVI